MQVTDVRINGIVNPMGFSFETITCSWKVVDFTDTYQKHVKIEISLNEDFESLFYIKEGADLKGIGADLKINVSPCTRYYLRIQVTGDSGESAISDIAYFETGKMNLPWKADYIGTKAEDSFHPVFFKRFTIKKELYKARLYVTGLGLYEAKINGEKIGEDYLAPFINDYNHAIQYQTYNVTEMINKENHLEIMVGNGWYKGWFGLKGTSENYGNRFAAIAELYIDYMDGSTELIKTDDSWQYIGSDIEDSGIYLGEIYNHMLWTGKSNSPKPVVILDEVVNPNLSKTRLKERHSIPVKVMEEISAKEIIITPKGETVLDFGQNFAGYVEFQSDLPGGTKIELKFGEILEKGNFYNDNYREAAAYGFTYVSDGKKEIVRPHFTFYGFRYVLICGWPGELKKNDFIGKAVYSEINQTGFISTSNSKINRLFENCIWGQKSNFLDIPTDCPQRNERLGWTGDTQIFAPTACYNMNVLAFYEKYLYDLRIEQTKQKGSIPNFIPNVNNEPGGSSVWGDVATFLPDTLYDFYGDVSILERHYSLMKEWVDYITREDEKRGEKNLFDFGFSFGDWLALDGILETSMKGGTDDSFISSVYYYASAIKVARAAYLTDKNQDYKYYKRLAEKIKTAVIKEYFTQSGRLAVDTQTAYLISLKFEIYPHKKKLLEGFYRRIQKDLYRLKGGFVGAPVMCTILGEHAMEDLAYDILLREDFPGWLYGVNLGATTIWERWNSVLPDGTMNPLGMNSLNHYAYGSVLEFLYRVAAGIRQAEPGFRKVEFAPKITNRFTYLKASYDSVSGKYVSEWKLNTDGTITVMFEVPFNCEATAILPDYQGEPIALKPGIFELTYRPEKEYLLKYDENTRLEQMADDKEALEILKKKLPIAYEIINTKDIEKMTYTLNECKNLFFMGFVPKDIGNTVEELKKLRIQL